jgi:hypothetical protein
MFNPDSAPNFEENSPDEKKRYLLRENLFLRKDNR